MRVTRRDEAQSGAPKQQPTGMLRADARVEREGVEKGACTM